MSVLEGIFGIGSFVVNLAHFYQERIRPLMLTLLGWRANETKSTPQKGSAAIVSDLKETNAEVEDLERKRRRDGRLSPGNQDRLEELEARRQAAFGGYQEAKTRELVTEAAAQSDTYTHSEVTDGSLHVLQYHMGQVVLEKKCTICGRPMFLQHRRRPTDFNRFVLTDFFWSCTGWFLQRCDLNGEIARQCTGKINFSGRDVGLLHNAGIPELQVSSADLNTIFSQNRVQKAITSRVRAHVGQEDDLVLCPSHHLPMVLHEKTTHDGVALDMYHLRCPHLACEQFRKLKSPAQLAAFLRRREGKGILD
jgi:hypothetical protein